MRTIAGNFGTAVRLKSPYLDLPTEDKVTLFIGMQISTSKVSLFGVENVDSFVVCLDVVYLASLVCVDGWSGDIELLGWIGFFDITRDLRSDIW